MWESTSFWIFKFGELEFHELEFYGRILKIFYGTRVHQNIFGKFEDYFFKEPEFMELEYHGKLKYPKSGRFLHISRTVVD